ncbi:MAG: hypothetical protein ACI9WU_004134 [Myxococcota bacterium]
MRLSWAVCILGLLVTGCSVEEPAGSGTAPTVSALHKGAPNVRVVVPAGAGPGILAAADELVFALSTLTKKPFPEPSTELDGNQRIRVVLGAGPAVAGPSQADPTGRPGLSADSYRITSAAKSGRWTVSIRGGSPRGLMYGVTELCQRLGVRYLHPQESVYPVDPDADLPLPLELDRRPDLAIRGHYQRTSRGIPLAELLHQPDVHRAEVDAYLRWLNRNRVNLLAFDLLDPDGTGALPVGMDQTLSLAASLGIEVVPVVGLSDDTGNAWPLIRDPEGDVQAQALAGLDALLAQPFDRVMVQLRASPGAQLTPDQIRSVVDAAAAHLAATHPAVELWVRVDADIGGSVLGALRDTNPAVVLIVSAPLIGRLAQSYPEQLQLLDGQSGTRKLVFAPGMTTSRGLDIDVPIALLSVVDARALDLLEGLADVTLLGSISVGAGLEWGAWLGEVAHARLAWDRTETLASVLAWIRPVLGKTTTETLQGWSSLLAGALAANPDLLWYLVGERPASEAALVPAEPARPLRPLLTELATEKEAAIGVWKQDVLAPLQSLSDGLGVLLGSTSAPEVPEEDTPQERFRREMDGLLRLTSARLALVAAAHQSVIALREPLEDLEAQSDRLDALEDLAGAQVKAATQLVGDGEARYRYSKWLLMGPREDEEGEPLLSVTTALHGYLEVTRTLAYWKRLQAELEDLLEFPAPPTPKWSTKPALNLRVDGVGVRVAQPDTDPARALLGPLFPPVLMGVHSWPQGGGDVDLTIALDRDGDGLPDPATTQLRIKDGLNRQQAPTLLQAQEWRIAYPDRLGQPVGELVMAPVNFELTPKHVGGAIQDILAGAAEGEVDTVSTAQLLVALSDETLDQRGATLMLARSAGVTVEELPSRLFLRVTFIGFKAR